MTRLSLAEVDPEAYLEDRAAAEALDDRQRGSLAERCFTNQFTDQPTRTARTTMTGACGSRTVPPAFAARGQMPATCAPATLLARHVLFRSGPTNGADTARHSLRVFIDLCGCLYRSDGGLLRYCAGTPIHQHEEGPR